MTKKEYDALYFQKYKVEYKSYSRLFHSLNPWLSHLYDARKRCNNSNCTQYKWYGAKGIKCDLTPEEIKILWFRDNACLLKQPSIDRINSKGNYTFDNCRFIEMILNAGLGTRHEIFQYSSTGNFIKKWSSLKEASNFYNVRYSALTNSIKRHHLSAGFKWSYTRE